jgi:hypothetical protein
MLLSKLEELDTLEHVPFGRNRLFAGLGAGLFAAAASMTSAGRALAAPYPCYGFDACTCCSGSTCWITCGCIYNYQCCDWQKSNGSYCICSGRLGQCGC